MLRGRVRLISAGWVQPRKRGLHPNFEEHPHRPLRPRSSQWKRDKPSGLPRWENQINRHISVRSSEDRIGPMVFKRPSTYSHPLSSNDAWALIDTVGADTLVIKSGGASFSGLLFIVCRLRDQEGCINTICYTQISYFHKSALSLISDGLGAQPSAFLWVRFINKLYSLSSCKDWRNLLILKVIIWHLFLRAI